MNNINNLPYDDTDPKDVFRYSQGLLNHNFVDVLSGVFESKELKEKVHWEIY